MNSEDKYNAALEKAKKLYGQDIIADESLEFIFPELAEPEDEKMWKLIKRYAQYNISDMALNADHITREQLVSWLEKQSERMSDDVEPKFHEGDWVVSPDNSVFKITHVNSHNYTLHLYNDDYRIFESERWYIDKEYRLWTIQDAQDGDVLCYETENEIRIFIYKNGHIHYHCCYYNKHLTTVDSFFVIQKHLLSYIHPATKEQYDLLFRKMKEAGYVWDAEQKVLKKIGIKTLDANKVID